MIAMAFRIQLRIFNITQSDNTACKMMLNHGKSNRDKIGSPSCSTSNLSPNSYASRYLSRELDRRLSLSSRNGDAME